MPDSSVCVGKIGRCQIAQVFYFHISFDGAQDEFTYLTLQAKKQLAF